MQTETTNTGKNVQLILGAGVAPIEVTWQPNMSIADVLKAANIELKDGETVVIGESAIDDIETFIVEPDQMLVIDDMPANG